jgi:hypothetical protein
MAEAESRALLSRSANNPIKICEKEEKHAAVEKVK